MRKLFKAQTSEGFTIKVLADLLQNNIKTACLLIDSKGIALTMYDSHKRVCFDLFLEATNFQVYKFRPSNSLYVGINLSHLYKMIKSIKKKDSIVLFIKEETPTDLGIKVVPKENNRITTSYIKIQHIQNLVIQLPTGYTNPIIVPSNEYQKCVKDMNSISSSVDIEAYRYSIKFSSDAGRVYSREVSFGELDADSDTEEEDNIRFTDTFNTEQLARIVKISGLGSYIQVFVKENLPMLFRTTVGNLGRISIYIKSKTAIEHENRPTLSLSA